MWPIRYVTDQVNSIVDDNIENLDIWHEADMISRHVEDEVSGKTSDRTDKRQIRYLADKTSGKTGKRQTWCGADLGKWHSR